MMPMTWRDRPFAVAASTAAATATLCIAIFCEVIIPTRDHEIAELRNKIADIGTTSPAIQSQSKKIAELEAEIAGLPNQEHETAYLRQELADVTAAKDRETAHFKQQLADLASAKDNEIAQVRKQLGDFGTASQVLEAKSQKIEELQAEIAKQRLGWAIGIRPDNPYPTDVVNIKIGTPIVEVERAYAFEREKVEVKDDWLSVPLSSGPFHQVTFYYDSTKHSPTVTHILYHLNGDQGFQIMLSEARKVFGTAGLSYTKRNGIEQWVWIINGMIATIGKDTYHVDTK